MSLNQEIYTKNCEPNTIIMHPLPRDSRPDANELDPDLNQNPNLAIYRQTDNGLLIRMALFSLVLGVQNKIEELRKISNHSNKTHKMLDKLNSTKKDTRLNNNTVLI